MIIDKISPILIFKKKCIILRQIYRELKPQINAIFQLGILNGHCLLLGLIRPETFKTQQNSNLMFFKLVFLTFCASYSTKKLLKQLK